MKTKEELKVIVKGAVEEVKTFTKTTKAVRFYGLKKYLSNLRDIGNVKVSFEVQLIEVKSKNRRIYVQ